MFVTLYVYPCKDSPHKYRKYYKIHVPYKYAIYICIIYVQVQSHPLYSYRNRSTLFSTITIIIINCVQMHDARQVVLFSFYRRIGLNLLLSTYQDVEEEINKILYCSTSHTKIITGREQDTTHCAQFLPYTNHKTIVLLNVQIW